jgi:Cu2+-exporting ATPase
VISNFVKKGILIKSGEALEKLRETDVIIFDKTGSLTLGQPQLKNIFLLEKNHLVSLSNEQRNFYLKLAASLAKKSRHVISESICRSYDGILEELRVVEKQGFGLESNFENKILKLGKKDFCDVKNNFNFDEKLLRCFLKFGNDELVFFFEDALKIDAKEALEQLKKFGKKIILLSGDDKKIVSDVAQKLEISEFYFEQTPLAKVNFLEKLKFTNKKFIMIGDGLNDAPALALSYVSISFSKASDLSQNIADIIIQGQKLMPIIELIKGAKKSVWLMKENLFIALVYNLFAVPFAVAGHVVPLIAAIAMSSSSLLVLFNSLRINKIKN